MLYSTAEAIHDLPDAVKLILFFTRPKPTGGRRIVANLPSFYRVYTRARVEDVRAWDGALGSDYFYAGEQKGSVDAMYDAAMEDSFAAVNGCHTLAAIGDIQKCFEKVPHAKLLEMAQRARFPSRILGVCIAMYQAMRCVQVHDATSVGVFTNCGVAAGCTMVTYLVRAYLMTEFDAFKYEYMGRSALYAIRLSLSLRR
jgi:hypothetical protein